MHIYLSFVSVYEMEETDARAFLDRLPDYEYGCTPMIEDNGEVSHSPVCFINPRRKTK